MAWDLVTAQRARAAGGAAARGGARPRLHAQLARRHDHRRLRALQVVRVARGRVVQQAEQWQQEGQRLAAASHRLHHRVLAAQQRRRRAPLHLAGQPEAQGLGSVSQPGQHAQAQPAAAAGGGRGGRRALAAQRQLQQVPDLGCQCVVLRGDGRVERRLRGGGGRERAGRADESRSCRSAECWPAVPATSRLASTSPVAG